MHPVFPMAGHVLPVIYSGHLGIELNELAGSYPGALDPAKFWVTWDRGLRTAADTFAADFVFWEHVEEPLDDLRREFNVAPLDPVHAASSQGATAGIHYHPIARSQDRTRPVIARCPGLPHQVPAPGGGVRVATREGGPGDTARRSPTS
jgi:hypothetical protein